MAQRPNILLITTDTQRCDSLACMGGDFAVSPHLDRLAAQGVMFTQAHAASPVCGPNRCCLLTGLHTPIHGAIENGIDRRSDVMVFPDLLAEAGYVNIMVGKTHFGAIPASFHINDATRGEKSKNSDDIYAQHLAQHGYQRATDHPNPVPEDLFCEAFLVNRTIQRIEQARREHADRPFFAFCSMYSPHDPLDPPGRWATLFDDRPLPPLNYVEGEARHHPPALRELLGMDDPPHGGENRPFHPMPYGRANMEVIDAKRRLYYGLCAYCDHQVGRLVKFLDDRGLRDNTLVIFSSDHGITLYDHGFYDKHNWYDSSWRVPLILSLPGALQAGATRDFATWTDLTATILGAAGIDSPYVQGFDLFTPLRNGGESPRRCAVGTIMRSCALATRRWKLEYYLDDAGGRLFDRVADPLERVDLYESAAHRGLRDGLLTALLAWRAGLTDVQHFREKPRGGGPIALRAHDMLAAAHGDDAERRLNDAVERVEARWNDRL